MTEKTSDTLGPLPKAALTVVHNPNTMERHVSTHGVAYYGSNWYAERECYTADQMRAYALQERAAERERCGQVYGSREVAMSDEIRRLAREAHTWSKAAESYAADAERFRWLAEHTVATGLARWVHPFQFLGEAVDARRNEATTNAAPRVTTAAELRQQAKSDTSCVGAFARARPGKA
ncbi:MAG: hypothetical protein RJA36_596 [Pseudomonadota bacterium]|jgi:hypothetical protein